MVEGKLDEEDLLKDVDLHQADLELVFTEPGSYTFELTVTDRAGITDSAQAKVIVEEVPDAKPTANAGKSVSINLPTDQVILCGNSSTDDKGIVEWLWTADGQNEFQTDLIHVHEKCLTVSGIQSAGIYKFNLKVFDEANQWDQASVQVKVNERINLAPVASINSPSVWTDPDVSSVFYIGTTDHDDFTVLQLNACDSTDDEDDLVYEFEQVTKIETLTINQIQATKCMAEVSGISDEGQLTFRVTVTDTGAPPLSDQAELTILVKLAEPPRVVVDTDIVLSQDAKYCKIDASDSFAYDHR